MRKAFWVFMYFAHCIGSTHCVSFLNNSRASVSLKEKEYSELPTAVDKGRDSDSAFLGRDTGARHAGSGCLLPPAAENLSVLSQQTTRASLRPFEIHCA
ncbi:hypothetical protein Y032_0007g3455 [Ancylostoma ceylanicum]|uniref:Secreted protein n=1 Tax=Ancylostoma ceylanicum TaxID=53326 RepID=A0A016VPZ4_9BILA|nr:hypothetical protein Y032_0007g3455 [Ancylostoma ceylanicum]